MPKEYNNSFMHLVTESYYKNQTLHFENRNSFIINEAILMCRT
jgi:hypothetical protein